MMANRMCWHHHGSRLWPMYGPGPYSFWPHWYCVSLPAFVYYQVSGFLLRALYRAGNFDLCNGETVNQNWRHVWRQIIGRE
jgi:hypothetical protein